MTPLELNKWRLENMKWLLSIVTPPEVPAIKEAIARRTFERAFLLYEKRLERALDKDFDAATSYKLDAVRTLIE